MWMISARLPSSFLGQFTNTRWKHLVEHDPGSRSSWAWIRSVGHQVQQAREVCFHTSHLKKFSSDNFCASFFAGVSKILCVIQLELCLSREMPSHLLFLLLLYSGNLFFSNEDLTGTVMSLKLQDIHLVLLFAALVSSHHYNMQRLR